MDWTIYRLSNNNRIYKSGEFVIIVDNDGVTTEALAGLLEKASIQGSNYHPAHSDDVSRQLTEVERMVQRLRASQ